MALLPIGAYEPRWFMGPVHMDPALAVRAHRDLGAAARSVAIHFGTFQMAFDELMDRAEAVENLAALDRSMEDVKAGRGQDLKQAVREVAKELGLQIGR